MTKLESVLVGLTLAILPPLLLMVLFWWSTAALAIYHILPISDKDVSVSAMTGLGLGIILDIAYVRKWVARFYVFDLKLMALVYLFCSAIAAAFCMGLPVGNFLLGILAGVYLGRRLYYSDQDKELSPTLTKRVGLFTAIVTGLWTLSIGLLALNEPTVVRLSTHLLGISREIPAGYIGMILVVFLSAGLMILQYWCTTTASWMSLKLAKPLQS